MSWTFLLETWQLKLFTILKIDPKSNCHLGVWCHYKHWASTAWSGPHVSPFWGQKKTIRVSHIKRWNFVCKSDEEPGLAHLKLQWGEDLSVFLGPLSATTPLQSMQGTEWFDPAEHFVHLEIWLAKGGGELHRSDTIVEVHKWGIYQKLNLHSWIHGRYWIKDYIIVGCWISLSKKQLIWHVFYKWGIWTEVVCSLLLAAERII